MEIVLKSKNPKREVVALIGNLSGKLFFKSGLKLDKKGNASSFKRGEWKYLISSSLFTSVYEGDEVVLKF